MASNFLKLPVPSSGGWGNIHGGTAREIVAKTPRRTLFRAPEDGLATAHFPAFLSTCASSDKFNKHTFGIFCKIFFKFLKITRQAFFLVGKPIPPHTAHCACSMLFQDNLSPPRYHFSGLPRCLALPIPNHPQAS
jgi:hypothetical protein